MKKFGYFLAGIAILAIVIYFFTPLVIVREKVRVPEVSEELNLEGYQTIDVYKVGTATNSPVWLEPTQDSTSTDEYVYTTNKVITTTNVSEIDMNLAFTASTSARLDWTYWFSDDGDNWYSEDANTDTSDVVMTHGATQLVHYWTPGVTTQVLKHIEINDNIGNINSNFMKVIFDVSTASGSLYAEINTKQIIN